jgi:dienelactone hydrolase
MSVLLCGILLAPAFLFTNYSGLPVSGNHEIKETSAILIDSSRTDPFEEDGSFREVPVHFYYPADAGTEEYPLVVFSHGAFGYYQSNTSTYMELASSGYTVAALDHPHHAFFTQDTSGNMVIVDGTFIDRAMNLDNDMSPEEQYALYTKWMTLRTADMNFAVDEIKTAVQNGTTDDSWFIADQEKEALSAMLEMTDTSKIGLMGHSMGGATSVELGRERSDISAVADIDGTMLGEYQGVENGEFLINEEPYPVPVLEFVNWESYIDVQQYVEQGGRYPNEILIRQADTGFSTTVKDTLHMDFTDLPMFSPYLGKLLGSGERSTEETMKIVNSAVLSFFNCYLKGEGVFTVQDIY